MFRVSRISRSPFADIQSSLVRSFRLEQLLTQVSTKDLVLAKQENDRVFSFVGFPGVDHDDVATRLLKVPQDMRYFHVVTGRERVPCDFFGDLDLDGKLSAKEAETICLQALQEVHRMYEELYASRSLTKSNKNNTSKAELSLSSEQRKKLALSTVVLHNPASLSKNSFHLHVHSPVVALGDYRVVASVADRVNASLKQPIFDLQCYRHCGMLRLAFNGKPNEPGTELVSFQPSNAKFQDLLKSTSKVDNQTVLRRSMALRPDAVNTKNKGKGLFVCRSLVEEDEELHSTDEALGGEGGATTKKASQVVSRSGQVIEYDNFGNKIHPFLKEANKMRRFQEAKKACRQLPPRAADSYDTWVRVGLALHNFGCEEEFLDEWVLFSLRSPQKYSRDACAKKWERFGRPDDAFNWRRGYNYLTKTIWRELGLNRTR